MFEQSRTKRRWQGQIRRRASRSTRRSRGPKSETRGLTGTKSNAAEHATKTTAEWWTKTSSNVQAKAARNRGERRGDDRPASTIKANTRASDEANTTQVTSLERAGCRQGRCGTDTRRSRGTAGTDGPYTTPRRRLRMTSATPRASRQTGGCHDEESARSRTTTPQRTHRGPVEEGTAADQASVNAKLGRGRQKRDSRGDRTGGKHSLDETSTDDARPASAPTRWSMKRVE